MIVREVQRFRFWRASCKWGGQLLWELRVPGGNDVPPGPGTTGLDATSAPGDFYGSVSYFHAGGIDKPLLITKEGAESVVPRETWRGQFHAGTSPATGAVRDCPVGVQTGCLQIAWPGMQTNAAHSWGGEQPDIRVWYGGLVDGMRDASGQMYMRNRYYDPATGQFTQTDPIGIAGGLNAYGFADGDPVSYDDPYGLCKRPKGSGIGICFETFIEGRYFGFGDNRGPSATGGSYKSSISFSIDPRSGTLSGVTTDIGYSQGKKGTGSLDVSAAADPSTGGWIVTMSGSTLNGEGVGPAIDFELNLHVGFDGNVTRAGGSHDGFPSYEVWVYRDGHDPQNIYYFDQGNRANIRKLFPANDQSFPRDPHP